MRNVLFLEKDQPNAPLLSVHAVIKTVHCSGASVYGGSSGRSKYSEWGLRYAL